MPENQETDEYIRPSRPEAASRDSTLLASSRGPEAPSAFVLAAPPVDEAKGELRSLVYRRLMLCGWLAFVGFVLNTVSRLGGSNLPSSYYPETLAFIRIQGSAAVFMACWLVVLRASRSSSLEWLRGLELLVCAIAVATFAAMDNFVYVAYAPFASETGPMFARASLLHWFNLLLVYGLIIPNTARRAAIGTGMIIVAAITSMLSHWLRLELRPGQLANWVALMVIYMGIAAALTVFASNRFEAARRAIAEVRKLGQYRLGRRLGGGGMGEVFLAEHRFLKRPCAIKLIRSEIAADPTFVKRFEREVQAATRLTHPSTVQVYDFGRAEDGALFYVMEYLPGLTLDQLVQQAGPLPPGRVVHILRQICGALAEAHVSGLVHRDVKPGNVMICRLAGRADVAKLFDFGLVAEPENRDTRITQVGGLLGTPAYMSPEQARGASVGPSSDLYALGAVGYFLLTGRSPFVGSNALELLHAHQSSPVVPPGVINPAIPADLEAVILRLLTKDPEGRFASAIALDNALAACEPGEWTNDDAIAWWDERRAEEGPPESSDLGRVEGDILIPPGRFGGPSNSTAQPRACSGPCTAAKRVTSRPGSEFAGGHRDANAPTADHGARDDGHGRGCRGLAGLGHPPA